MRSRTSLWQRLQAGLVHLALSFCVALVAAAAVFLVWYPTPLWAAQGVDQVMLILLGVDIALGPVITTIVFDRRKKALRGDLTVVGCLQLTALLYGMHTLFVARPVLLVFNVDRFDIVSAIDVDRSSLAKARQQGQAPLSWSGPRVVAATLPKEPRIRTELLFSTLEGGPDLPQLPEWHIRYEDAREFVVPRIRPLSELYGSGGMNDSEWRAFLSSLPHPPDELGYLPLRARSKDGAVIVDRETAEIVAIRLVQPNWEAPLQPSAELTRVLSPTLKN